MGIPANKKKTPQSLQSQGFQGVLVGGDKRDRTADLLNAIQNIIVVPLRLTGAFVSYLLVTSTASSPQTATNK